MLCSTITWYFNIVIISLYHMYLHTSIYYTYDDIMTLVARRLSKVFKTIILKICLSSFHKEASLIILENICHSLALFWTWQSDKKNSHWKWSTYLPTWVLTFTFFSYLLSIHRITNYKNNEDFICLRIVSIVTFRQPTLTQTTKFIMDNWISIRTNPS